MTETRTAVRFLKNMVASFEERASVETNPVQRDRLIRAANEARGCETLRRAGRGGEVSAALPDRGPEPRVPCPSCNGAGTCMLCDDNGLVPLSSLTPEQRKCPPRAPSAMTRARIRTALVLAGSELPECFQNATLEATINAYERSTVAAKASRRRLTGKVVRIAEGGR